MYQVLHLASEAQVSTRASILPNLPRDQMRELWPLEDTTLIIATMPPQLFRSPAECDVHNLSRRRNSNQGAHRTQGKAMPTCQQCRKEKLVSMFRTTRGKKSEICKECEQVICAGCAREKPNAAFDACTVKNYWALGRQAVRDAYKKRGCSNRDTKLYRCLKELH